MEDDMDCVRALSHFLQTVDYVSAPIGRLEFPSFRARIPAKHPTISQLNSGIGPDSR